MAAYDKGERIRDGYQHGNQGGRQQITIEAVTASASSSAGSARHNGHTKAREHDASYRPQRQAGRA